MPAAGQPIVKPAPRVLIVEDDYDIASNLLAWLDRAGFEVDAAYQGRAALHKLSTERFDVLVLDIGLPGLDGLDLLRRARGELCVSTPVLVVSARTHLSDKLAGFEQGADDYVVKPFALAEIEARIRALLHRSQGTVVRAGLLACGALRFDAAEGSAAVDETPVRLTPKTAALLEMLLRHPGQLVRRSQIDAALWPEEPPNADAVRSLVHALRRALSEAGFEGVLDNVHGVGYRLVDRVERT